jgi:hypothetical protein
MTAKRAAVHLVRGHGICDWPLAQTIYPISPDLPPPPLKILIFPGENPGELPPLCFNAVQPVPRGPDTLHSAQLAAKDAVARRSLAVVRRV